MEALLRRLELLTGLPPVHQRSNGRFARWHRAVRRDDDGTRAYSRSADVDPIGVSQHLLSLRDDLKRSGWRDQVLRGSQRLEALDRLDRSVEVASSVADRIHRVIDELRTLGSLGLTLVLSEPERHLAASDRALVDAIRGAGGEVRGVGDDDIPTADTDLGRVQRAVLGHDRAELIGDGTVRMLTTDTPWEAAERLCAGPTQVGEAWVVADEGPLLDRARARFALPRFGMEPVAPEWPVDELLDLAFDIAHNPRDVRAIHAFLTLPTGPLPAALARSLARVLQNEPAPWGAAWVLAVEQAASSAARAAHRSTSDPSAAAAAAQELRALVGRWFPDPAAPRPANAEDHRRLVNELACWAVETGAPLSTPLEGLVELLDGLPPGPLDRGTLGQLLSPEEVSHRTLAAVERCIAEAGPGLLEAGRAAERARLTRQIVHAAGELAEQLRAGGWWPVAAEARVEGRFAGQPFGGFVDLDVARSDGAVAVVDIKLGHSASRRTELTEGRALQLAMYASGRREDPDRWPVAAYFVVQDARMIATSDDFPEAVVTGGPSLAQTWRDAEHGALAWFRELHSGRVHARDPDLPAPPIAADVPSNPLTTVAAPCGTCEFRVLCSPRTTS